MGFNLENDLETLKHFIDSSNRITFLQVLVYLLQAVFQISVQWAAYLMKFQRWAFARILVKP